MAAGPPVSNVFARCEQCDSVFVAEEHPDGSIRPIGMAKDCRCGDGEFVVVA